jgi:predicted acyltransferase
MLTQLQRPLPQMEATSTVPARLVSLDVMRGITVAFMILVNNDGDPHSYWPLLHARWNGWTPTDLVFPTFLFLMGTSLVLSFESRMARGVSKASLLLHSIRRSLLLFLLGLVVNGFPFFPLATLRIYGVLQRIAICFLLASLFYLWDRRPATKIIAVAFVLLGYWALMRWIPVPGFGLPGRDVPFLDRSGNLVSYVDRRLFPHHLYPDVYDPEGLLSSIPALATTLLGMLSGMWLRSNRGLKQKALSLLVCGLVALVLGKLWDPVFPINKKLWTSSYVVFTAGWALITFAICYWAVEIKGWKAKWTYFWLVFGTNAITAYVFSELLASTFRAIDVHGRNGVENLQRFLFDCLSARLPSLYCASLVYAVCFVLISFVPVAILYRRKLFIKV